MNSLPKKRVLIIDDDAALRRAVGRMLRSEFDVSEAASAEHALQEILCVAFDAVVIDLQMPKCDGWETLRRITAHDARLGAPLCQRA